MKLESIEIFGEYKGLRNQEFDFSSADGDVAVLIGANGSGKSQVMELIAEVFSYLERAKRDDFRVRGELGYHFRVSYLIASSRFEGLRRYVIDSRDGIQVVATTTTPDQTALGNTPTAEPWFPISHFTVLQEVFLPRIVGYASGLSENLQRPFMRNALQFHDVIRVRSALKEELGQADVDEEKTIAINSKYLGRYPGIFAADGDPQSPDLFQLREADTLVPRSLFLDYDCAALLIALLGMLPKTDRDSIWPEIPFRHPTKAIIRFDLRGLPTASDNAKDIQRLIEMAGPGKLTPLTAKTTPEQYDIVQLDYLAGEVELDFNFDRTLELIGAPPRDPSDWFFALYKLQLLGVKEWAGSIKIPLRRDSFQGHVEKPLKGKLPLSVQELWMSDGEKTVAFDDLSDGEVQLLLTLGAVRLFGDDETLFLYDEPETHLNPSWRTRFHLDFEKSNASLGSAQAFITSHSPFLVSSLSRKAVFLFKKLDGKTTMEEPPSETFGASFDVLIKKFFGLQSTISQTAIDEIRKQLAEEGLTKEQKRAWVDENVGESVERVYLLKKLGT